MKKTAIIEKIKEYKKNYEKPTPLRNRLITDILLIIFSSVSSAIIANMEMIKEYFTLQQIKYFVICIILLSAIIKILSNFGYEEHKEYKEYEEYDKGKDGK